VSKYPDNRRPGLGRRAYLHALHISVRVLMWCYGAAISMAKLLGPRKRAAGDQGYEFLLTGTFYSDNWISSHLRPLAQSRYCARIRVVTAYPIAPIDKVQVVAPAAWLARIFGAVPARLLTFIWIGMRERPHFVGGFHLLFNGLMAAFLGKLIGARSLYFCVGGPAEVLGGGIQSENRVFEKLETPDAVVERQLLRAVENFDLIVAMGSTAKQFYRGHGITAPIQVVSGGLDAARYAPSNAPALTDLIFVGRLAPIKRVDLFLQAIKQIQGKMPKISAVVVGDGQLRDSLERLANDLGISRNVQFVGQQPEVGVWLRQARIFVLTSDSEGLSLALVEAMLCGLPAVVSRVGDLGDIVEDGVSGYLVGERQASAFAERLLELLEDRNRREKFSQAARHAAKRYELSACTQLWDNILGSVEERPARVRPLI